MQNERGVSDFGAVRSAISRAPERLIFFAFDLLHLNGRDLRKEPVEARLITLVELLSTIVSSYLVYSDACVGDGAAMFKLVDE